MVYQSFCSIERKKPAGAGFGRAAFLIAFICLLVLPTSAVPAQNTSSLAYAPDEIIVKFKQPPSDAPALFKSLASPNVKYKVKDIQPLFKNFQNSQQRLKTLATKEKQLLTPRESRILARQKRAPAGAKIPDLGNIFLIKLDLNTGTSIRQALRFYQSQNLVEYAELNYTVSAHKTPNDPLFGLQWALDNTGQDYPSSHRYKEPPGTPDVDIDAPEAWDVNTGSSSVIVAILDTGVDYNHRDLHNNIWFNPAELAGNPNVDDDNNGYIDDFFGYNFAYDTNDPLDDNGHGTHVAGTIAAEGNNALDVAGLSWNANVMALKFLGANGTGFTSNAVRAFYYAVENGADVVSNSWGGAGFSQALEDAINYAHSQGLIIVASAGNDDSNRPVYPAFYENVIAVAATDSNDQRARFSNYGDWVDLAAPGVDILSLRATGTSRGTIYDQYTTVLSGTSMSCPHVSGAAAVVLAEMPDLTNNDVGDLLTILTDPIAAGIVSSNGRLNLFKAMTPQTGRVGFGRQFYSCNDQVIVNLTDLDLRGQISQNVTIETSGGDLEIVTLHPAGPDWLFTGQIFTSPDVPIDEDGVLQLAHDQLITVTYNDLSDHTGLPATASAAAITDCVFPRVTELQIDSAGPEPTVYIETDELTAARLLYSTECNGPNYIELVKPNLASSHTITLYNVAPHTTYYFLLKVTDIAGNQTIDDNSGRCYSFVTDGPTDVYVPSGYRTIQQAIDHSWPSGTVWVADGTYTGDGNRDIDYKGKSITVRSQNGPQECVIDCNASESDRHRAFDFRNGEDQNAVLDGFSIINGYQETGGAISCSLRSSPTIRNCHITQNSAESAGAGIYTRAASPVIQNCNISYNNGSAIYSVQDIDVGTSSPTIQNCMITHNTDIAVYLSSGTPKITNCLIAQNSTNSFGGGVRCLDVNLQIKNSSISANFAYDAAAIFADRSNVKIYGCTFRRNKARVETGAIACASGSRIIIRNSIIYDNLPLQITLWSSTSSVFASYSNIQGGWPGAGNINTNPLFALGVDDRLLPESPCIDAADPNYIPSPVDEADLDGNPRIIGATIDMGAYEFNPLLPSIAVSAREFTFRRDVPETKPQLLHIINAGGQTLNWEIRENCRWLRASPASGASTDKPSVVTLNVNPASLNPGLYTCTLTISDPCAINSPVDVSIKFQVGRTIRVPSQFSTIQSAIDAAHDYDIIIVADGTYTGEGNSDIDFLGKSITLRSQNGPQSCIIDCGASEQEPNCAFIFHTAETRGSVLDGFTITNGFAPGDTPDDRYGGAIICFAAGPTIKNCVFLRNVAQAGAGAIAISAASPAILDCSFIENAALLYEGGAIANYGANPDIINCTFIANEANDIGGAVLNAVASSPTIKNCIFTQNSTKSFGGALFCYHNCNPAILNSIFLENYAPDGSTLATDSFNQNFPSIVPISNSIILDSPPRFHNADNSSIAITYSDCLGGCPGQGNFDAGPQFTDPNAGNFRLLSSSPCIDGGDPNYIRKPNDTDLDGAPRVTGALIDVGPYEYAPPLQAQMNITPKTIRCRPSHAPLVAHVTLPEGISAADIDTQIPAVITPSGIQSQSITIHSADPVKLRITFSRGVFCDAFSGSGPTELTVTFYLKTHRPVQASDLVNIISR